VRLDIGFTVSLEAKKKVPPLITLSFVGVLTARPP